MQFDDDYGDEIHGSGGMDLMNDDGMDTI